MRMIMKSVMAGALVSLATMPISGGANAALCPTTPTTLGGNYTTLTGGNHGFSCQIDDKNFSNFVDVPNGTLDGGTRPEATGITVIPSGFGFNFAGLWNAPPSPLGSSADSTLSYRVNTIDGASIITDA